MMKVAKKKKRKKKHLKTFTPWHTIFQYILEELLPGDIFDIQVEHEVGKLPLKIDFIIIKKIKEAIADVPGFLSFLNDYEYAVIEYKSPHDEFTFDDFLKLAAYTTLYKIKKEIADLEKIIRVGVFNSTSKDFSELMKQYGYEIGKIENGLYYIAHNPEKAYLINIEEIDKSDKALLLAFLSKTEDSYDKAYAQLIEEKFFNRFAGYIDYLTHRRDFMRLIKQDKEWAKRANRTLEQIVQDMDPEIRLKGLKPEERLKGLTLEELLKGLKPEERLEGLKPEEIEAYLKKQKQSN